MVAPVQYASAGEFDAWAAPAAAYRGVTAPEKNVSLQWGARILAGFISKRKVLPLVSWGDDLKAVNCELAAYDLMCKRGFRPESGADTNFRQRYEDAIAWGKLVATGQLELVDCVDSSTTPTVDQAGTLAASDPIVNWNFQTRGNNCPSDQGGGLG